MIIALIVVIIIEISQIFDIILAEYAINRDLLEEGNPLFKKKKVRYYVGNPIQLGIPIYLYCMFYVFYRYISPRKIIFICLICYMCVSLTVLIYNSALITSVKKIEKLNKK